MKIVAVKSTALALKHSESCADLNASTLKYFANYVESTKYVRVSIVAMQGGASYTATWLMNGSS